MSRYVPVEPPGGMRYRELGVGSIGECAEYTQALTMLETVPSTLNQAALSSLLRALFMSN